jgi:ubiquinone/menaquinone biosynthesis C-methylase UbiE
MNLNVKFRKIIFRIWYNIVNRLDKKAEILFMNYGFHDQHNVVHLDKDNEINRYSIQLYHHLASTVEIKNKDIVEVGCGRGGGLSYVSKRFSASSAIGIDMDKKAVSFCNRFYNSEVLSFFQGDAMKLKLNNESCDVVINVESSHRYSDFSLFLSEVNRVLRPGGYFLFTDFRSKKEMPDMKLVLSASKLQILKERIVNKEVVAALVQDDKRKRKLVSDLVPRFLQKVALNFAGTIGSETYKRLVSGRYIYFSYVIQKV